MKRRTLRIAVLGFFLLARWVSGDVAWKTVCSTNDVGRGWTNSNYLFLNAVAPTNYIGQTMVLEGRINMADTNWIEILRTNFVPNAQMDFRNVPFHFFRARFILP